MSFIRCTTHYQGMHRTIAARTPRAYVVMRGTHAREAVDVAISGGGPAGLAVAHAILRACPGKRVKVRLSVEPELSLWTVPCLSSMEDQI